MPKPIAIDRCTFGTLLASCIRVGKAAKFISAALLCFPFFAFAETLQPLPATADKWFANPLAMNFAGGHISCAVSNAQGLAVYDAMPMGSNVTIVTTFLPQKADSPSWATVGAAIVEDNKNFWALSLVKGPMPKNVHFFELAEMHGGVWLSQGNLKVEANEQHGQWEFGKSCRFELEMDGSGIEGKISDTEGKLLYRKRFAFSGPAVRYGRIAVKVGGFRGAFDGLEGQVSQTVADEEKLQVFPPYAVQNTATGITGKATGFFRVEQKPDGRWWAIGPDGRGVVLLGVDHVTYRGHSCEKLGYSPHYRKNKAKYTEAQWEEETLGRLKNWGFTMLGGGCSARLRYRGLAHTEFLSFGSSMADSDDEYNIVPNLHKPCSAFPNVFSPKFAEHCRYQAKMRCAENRSDPWLFGYFIDNELAWWGRDSGRDRNKTGMFNAVLQKPAMHSAKIALRDFLKEKSAGDIAAFNAFWGQRLRSFDEILALTNLPQTVEAQVEAKHDFLRLAAERYFSISAAAIRAEDPNHIVMGSRFAGTGGADPVVWEVAGKYCEVVTFNCYPMADIDRNVVFSRWGKTAEPIADHFTEYYHYVNRPLLVTEWSFPALDSGLPCLHGAGQRFYTQAERTQATSLFARTMLSLPFLLGYDYFMWVDQPALGISENFPEDSNYGLINEDGVPYKGITSMFAELQKDVTAWRFKPTPAPIAFTPRVYRAPELAFSMGGDKAQPASFTRGDNGTFTLQNGKLALAGKIGGDGISFGRYGVYTAMLQVLKADHEWSWQSARKVLAVSGTVSNGVAIADVTFARMEKDTAFEIVHRLYLPSGVPWFIAECRSVKNTGAAPLAAGCVFFRLDAPFWNTPQKKLPPNLWGKAPASCWLDDTAKGLFAGMCAPRETGAEIRFWVDSGRHPDARYELPENTVVKPGETFAPVSPAFLFCTVGEGGENAWNARVNELVKGWSK